MDTHDFKHLKPGRAYVVIRAFVDFDNERYEVGERWIFRGSGFLPYDDGLSLFAEIDGRERQVRMRWMDGDQGEIVDRLDEHLAPET